MPAVKRNGEIDFWKFVASFFIVLFHTRTFYEPDIVPSGFAMAVEFFFIATGYFLAASVYRDQRPFDRHTIGTETVRFMKHKAEGFLYYFLIGFLFSAAVFVYQYGLRACLKTESLMNYFFEFTLLSNVTVTPSPVLPVDWYLSAMLAALFLIYPLFRRNKDLFSAWIAPILGFGGIGYILSVYGVFAASADGVFPPKNVIRAGVSICLGVVCYRLAGALREKKLKLPGKLACSAAAMCAVLGMFASFFFVKGKSQAFVIVFAMVFVTVCMSGHSVFSRFFPAGLCKRLGQFGLALYLSHTAVRSFLLKFMQSHDDLKAWFSTAPCSGGAWFCLCCSRAPRRLLPCCWGTCCAGLPKNAKRPPRQKHNASFSAAVEVPVNRFPVDGYLCFLRSCNWTLPRRRRIICTRGGQVTT